MGRNYRYPAMVSVKNLASQRYRYCKHLCRIDRPSKHDIRLEYLYFYLSWGYIYISVLWPFSMYLNVSVVQREVAYFDG